MIAAPRPAVDNAGGFFASQVIVFSSNILRSFSRGRSSNGRVVELEEGTYPVGEKSRESGTQPLTKAYSVMPAHSARLPPQHRPQSVLRSQTQSVLGSQTRMPSQSMRVPDGLRLSAAGGPRWVALFHSAHGSCATVNTRPQHFVRRPARVPPALRNPAITQPSATISRRSGALDPNPAPAPLACPATCHMQATHRYTASMHSEHAQRARPLLDTPLARSRIAREDRRAPTAAHTALVIGRRGSCTRRRASWRAARTARGWQRPTCCEPAY